PGQGSTFTLYLPMTYSGSARHGQPSPTGTELPAPPSFPALAVAKSDEAIPDDRDEIEEGDLTMLIVEDDPHYAQILLEMARERGFKGLVCETGQAGLALARKHAPTAIT